MADEETPLYEVDRVIRAKLVGDAWHVSVKWKGYRSPTWEPLDSIYPSATQAVKDEIDTEVAKVRAADHLPTREPDFLSDKGEAEPAEPEPDAASRSIAKRTRSPVDRYAPEGGTTYVLTTPP